MATISIALKMGSTSTVIFKQGEGIVLSEPSLIAVSATPKGKIVRAVGIRAKRLVGRTDKGTDVFAPIFRGAVADSELASLMLKNFLEKVIEKSIRKPFVRAIVCTPVGLSPADISTFEKVCLDAGISEVTFVPSVLCGAVGLSLPVLNAGSNFVLSLGGGTTDVAVVSNGNIISGVSLGFGGNDLDIAIENFVSSKFKIAIGDGVAERLKCETASLFENDSSSSEFSGVDLASSETRTDVVSATELFSTVDEFFEKIVQAVKDVINTCTPEIVSDIANEGVHVFGSGAAIAGLERYLRKKLNIPVKIDESASYADVAGAGKLLSDSKLLKELVFNL